MFCFLLCSCELLKHGTMKFFKKNNQHGHAMFPFQRQTYKETNYTWMVGLF